MTANNDPAQFLPNLVSNEVSFHLKDVPKGSTYLEEAEFGLRRILPAIADLRDGARVLEVGSGPCILLSEIAVRFPNIHLEGIEPMGDGFAYFEQFISRMQKAKGGFKVYKGGYETFPAGEPWDLIFLVNVFEHLPDWRNFLDFVGRNLSEKGRCIVLCPNYGFSYESHFRLPILWNKEVTGRVFRGKIQRFEHENDNDGLFRSLNFVKLSQVRAWAPRVGLRTEVNTGIIKEMVDRLRTDPEFARRQRILAVPAKFLSQSGILDALAGMEFFQNRLPYMQIEFVKDGAE